MIIQSQVWLESKNYSDPSVEKSVINDLLYKSIQETLRLKSSDLNHLSDSYFENTKNFRLLIKHLKELEAIPVTNQRVLETMRKGIKENT